MRKRWRWGWGAVVAMLALPLWAQTETLSHGRFKDVRLYRPAGEARSVVLFLSGEAGWDRTAVGMAQALQAQGALVAGISTPALFKDLEQDGGDCVFPDGDLENLSHFVQGYARLPTYRAPILAGYASGATLAYAMLAQAPADTFAGALTLGFCPELDLRKPLCRGEDVHFRSAKDGSSQTLLPAPKLAAPWIGLQGQADADCPAEVARTFAKPVAGAEIVVLPKVTHRFDKPADWNEAYLAAYRKLASAQVVASVPAAPASLGDLPVIEVAAKPGSPAGNSFAVLLSGDGGWAGIDKEVAAAIAAKGMPVVGFDSLRYFWSERTPAGLAADLDRLLRFYAAQWKRSRVVLIGYSQGADVLPFALNRMPAATRGLVQRTVLMGLGQTAAFEFHLDNWIGGDRGAIPILPEALKLVGANTLCLYGEDDDESLCPRLPAANATVQRLAGGHHFDGEYEALADRILQGLR